MIIKEKTGNLKNFNIENRLIDLLQLEWYESNKRILHKRTASGMEVIIKFLKESPALTQDDILYEDKERIIVVDILSCDAIVIKPKSMYEAASICYEIGNKHLPLFYQDDEIIVPYEAPLFRLLSAAGFGPAQEKRKLLQPLKTTISPHGHSNGSETLFSKILKLTTSANE